MAGKNFTNLLTVSEKTYDEAFMMFNDMNRIFIEGVALELVKKMGHELLLSMVYSMTMTQIQYFIQNPERFEDKISREQAFNLV